jgi:hypothetical protein
MKSKKKITKKKIIKKKKSMKKKNILKDTNPDHYFFVQDGKVIKNVLELSRQLDNMADDIFRHHVNDMKNDFASWIKNVFKQEKLAKELLKTTDKDKTQIIILKHIIKKFS